MTKNAPAAPDATLALQTVAEASIETSQTSSPQEAPSSMTSRCLEPCFSASQSPRRLSMRSRPNAGIDGTRKSRRGMNRRRLFVFVVRSSSAKRDSAR